MDVGQRLFTPGPTRIPEAVQRAMADRLVYHRGPEFPRLLREAVDGLQEIFPTRYDILFTATSGTGVMEAAVVNTLDRGDRALVVHAGSFGARWMDLCRAYGVEVVEAAFPWGEAADPDVVKRLLGEISGIRAVFATQSETSTGVLHDIEAIGRVVQETEALFMVDGVSSVVAHALPLEAWGVDLAVTASQKGLGLPPGMGIVAVSPRVWEAAERSRLPRFYLDLRSYRTAMEEGRGPATLPVTILQGLLASVQLLRKEGMEQVWSRHGRHAAAVRAAAEAIGLSVFARRPSNALTSIALGEDLDGGALQERLRTEYGVVIGGGLGETKGRVVRISNLGHMDDADILEGVDVLERAMKDLGRKHFAGAGVDAATSILSANKNGEC